MRTLAALAALALLSLTSCAKDEPAKPWGFSCSGFDEYESEALANECHDLGGTCAGQDGGPPICVPADA